MLTQTAAAPLRPTAAIFLVGDDEVMSRALHLEKKATICWRLRKCIRQTEAPRMQRPAHCEDWVIRYVEGRGE